MLSVVSPLSALKSIIWRGVRPYRSWMRAGSYMIVPPAPMRVNISWVWSDTSWSMSRSPDTMTVSMPWSCAWRLSVPMRSSAS